MQLHVSGHHVDVTPALKGYVEKKLDRIVRHSDRVIDVHCILSVEKVRHKAEATVMLSGGKVFADAVMPSRTNWTVASRSTKKSSATTKLSKRRRISRRRCNGGAWYARRRSHLVG